MIFADNDQNYVEIESKEPSDTEFMKDEDYKDNESNSNRKDDTFDSDIEEEEEHVPLNIETTSDIEKSDDDLDESNEPSNTYDSDKEENCKTPMEAASDCLDPLDISTPCQNENTPEESKTSEETDSSTDELERPSEEAHSPKVEVHVSQLNSDEIKRDGDNTATNETTIDNNSSEVIDENSIVEAKKNVASELDKDNSDVNEESEKNTLNKSEDKEKEDAVSKETGICPLLMETLTRKNDDNKDGEDDREEDMDEALFDPLLLCPDISMEVDEAPVITTNGMFSLNPYPCNQLMR